MIDHCELISFVSDTVLIFCARQKLLKKPPSLLSGGFSHPSFHPFHLWRLWQVLHVDRRHIRHLWYIH